MTTKNLLNKEPSLFSFSLADKPLQNNIALITGASQGIGAAVAEAYAAAGAELILVGRSIEELEKTDDSIRKYGKNPLLVPMDLRHFLLIEQLAQKVAEKYGRLDILVGNAGYLHGLTPLTHLSPREWEQTLQTNLTANWQLLRWFEPLLQQSPQKGRVIFVTAEEARDPKAYWGAYSISKAALETLAKIYIQETIHIRLNLIDPGAVQTALRLKAMPGENPNTLSSPSSVTNIFIAAAHPDCSWQGELLYPSHSIATD
jgi:NAD(P)-dependent dehydrogenase (short-subunit alcohol dehydrogenase family)